MNVAAARTKAPRWWLVTSLFAGLATYAVADHPDRQAPLPWIAIDLFLVLCIWRGSRRALSWYRLLQTLGLVVVTFLWFLSPFTSSITVQGSSWSLVPYALSVWCAYAPALTEHVAEPIHPPNPSPTSSARR